MAIPPSSLRSPSDLLMGPRLKRFHFHVNPCLKSLTAVLTIAATVAATVAVTVTVTVTVTNAFRI